MDHLYSEQVWYTSFHCITIYRKKLSLKTCYIFLNHFTLNHVINAVNGKCSFHFAKCAICSLSNSLSRVNFINAIVKIINLYIIFLMYSLVSLLSSICPSHAMHSLLVTIMLKPNFIWEIGDVYD